MKQNTQRDQADEQVERIKSALKNTGLDYYMEESPYRLSIHLKKSFIQDFSPRLSEDLVWAPTLTSTSSPIIKSATSPTTRTATSSTRHMTENDSGLLSQDFSLCSSCQDKEKQLEDVNRELVKVLVDHNATNDKLEGMKSTLVETNEKLKKVQAEAVNLKAELKTKKEQLKHKNANLESIQKKLDKCTTNNEADRENFNNKVKNLEMQNGNQKNKIDDLKRDIKTLKAKNRNNRTIPKYNQLKQLKQNPCILKV